VISWPKIKRTNSSKSSIQAYVQYPKELKKKGKKVAMKIISHAWRSYNSKLVKIWRDQDTPFDKYKDLPKEDCVWFVEKCESENFAMNSQYMQWLRSQNELDHHLSNTDYAEKQRKWQQEDERLAQQGLENPYHEFCGWVGPFMRAHSKLTESGDELDHHLGGGSKGLEGEQQRLKWWEGKWRPHQGPANQGAMRQCS
jgi:hypothetical protein